jgi:subtilase family serine protease
LGSDTFNSLYGIPFDVFVITPLSTGSETLKFVIDVAESEAELEELE